MPSQSVDLNGFVANLSAATFAVYLQELPNSEDVRALREEIGGEWFLAWADGVAYGIPRVPNPTTRFGESARVQCNDHLKLLAARIADILPEKFSSYDAFRLRPFTFLGQRDELVEAITRRIPGLPPMLSRFKIRPRFQLDARLVELRDDNPFIGLFMDVNMRWEILAPLTELAAAGVDLKGLYVVRREPEPDQRRLVGRVERLEGRTVYLSETFDANDTISVEEVWLEGSKHSFTRCLKPLLGNRYQTFEKERDLQEARFLTGPAIEGLLKRMGEFLQQASPMWLSADLECSVGGRIKVGNTVDYQSVVQSAQIEYCFDAARTKRSSHPWTGIETFGPFSRDTFSKKSPRVLVVFPDTVQGAVETFLRSFRDGITLPDPMATSHFSGGFGKAFGLVNPEFVKCRVPWLAKSTANPATAYRQRVEEYLQGADSPPDAAFVITLDEHSQLPDDQDPYLHAKALLLMVGTPVQEARLSTITKPAGSLQFICQNLAIALYAKLNGTPWTVSQDLTVSDEIVIGMGTVELSGSRFFGRQRFVGVTTVFRGDGNYLLGQSSKECTYEEYPAVLRSTTIDVLREIKERNGWRPNDTVRIVFHAFRPLRRVDIAKIVADCVQEVGTKQNIEFAFLTISEAHPFMALDKTQPGIVAYRNDPGSPKKGVYAPDRGTIVQIGRYSRLLAVNGPQLIKRAQSSLPSPLLIHLHRESTFKDQTYLTEQVLKFTALSWRSILPASRPVTVYYSELIANLLARLRVVPDWSPAMLNIKLRASRWFL